MDIVRVDGYASAHAALYERISDKRIFCGVKYTSADDYYELVNYSDNIGNYVQLLSNNPEMMNVNNYTIKNSSLDFSPYSNQFAIDYIINEVENTPLELFVLQTFNERGVPANIIPVKLKFSQNKTFSNRWYVTNIGYQTYQGIAPYFKTEPIIRTQKNCTYLLVAKYKTMFSSSLWITYEGNFMHYYHPDMNTFDPMKLPNGQQIKDLIYWSTIPNDVSSYDEYKIITEYSYWYDTPTTKPEQYLTVAGLTPHLKPITYSETPDKMIVAPQGILCINNEPYLILNGRNFSFIPPLADTVFGSNYDIGTLLEFGYAYSGFPIQDLTIRNTNWGRYGPTSTFYDVLREYNYLGANNQIAGNLYWAYSPYYTPPKPNTCRQVFTTTNAEHAKVNGRIYTANAKKSLINPYDENAKTGGGCGSYGD